jgi:hypothetical protein
MPGATASAARGSPSGVRHDIRLISRLGAPHKVATQSSLSRSDRAGDCRSAVPVISGMMDTLERAGDGMGRKCGHTALITQGNDSQSSEKQRRSHRPAARSFTGMT